MNFRNCNYIFGGVVLLLCFLEVKYSIGIAWLFVWALLYCSLLFYGSYFIGSNFYLEVLCSGSDAGKKLALSFDDGPVNEATDEILKILRNEQVKAGFFCIGKNITGNERLLQRIVEEGHFIGNHSHSHHFWFDLFPAKKMTADLLEMEQKTQFITGFKTRLFRPPYGVTTPVMRAVLRSLGYQAIGWNLRSMDTVIKSDEQLLGRLVKGLRPGAVLLLHDHCAVTRRVLPVFIRAAKERGYEFTRPDKLLNVTPYV